MTYSVYIIKNYHTGRRNVLAFDFDDLFVDFDEFQLPLRRISTSTSISDNVPSRFLKDFAHVLADPFTVVPRIWKESNIIPIPKVQQPESEGDTRPISLTSCLSKLLEDFVVQ